MQNQFIFKILINFYPTPDFPSLLEGCKDIERLVLHKASYIDDGCLYELQYLRSSLKQLQVSASGNITDEGLKKLAKLRSEYN